MVTAGVLGLAGTAAHDAVEAVEAQPADTVLVSGATGGMGVIAVQLLKTRGAHVIATAATEEETAFVRDHGREEVVDCRGDLAAAVSETHPDGITATLAQLVDTVAAGAIRVPIMRTYHLDDVPRGLEDFAAGKLGKLAVRIHD